MVDQDVRVPPVARKKATAIEVAAWASAGGRARYGCGDGLWLQVTGTAVSWLLRYRFAGRARSMGLGSYPQKKLANARQDAAAALAQVRAGIDPVEARRAASAPPRTTAPHLRPTFKQVALEFIAGRDAGWRNRKHAAQWTSTLKTYAFPRIGDTPVDEITTDDILAIVQPIWKTKPETAARVRGRIEAVLSAAKVRGLRTGENPAAWRDHLALLLPAKGKVRAVQHHPALPWPQIPAFIAEAAEKSGVAWAAIRFAVLTAARSGEVRGACWGEINLKAKVWTVPASRMKAGKEHKVPLSSAAMAILAGLSARLGEDRLDLAAPVFPAAHGGRLSDMALTMPLRRSGWKDAAGDPITLHGTARSSFRDWASEATGHPDTVCEAALAHVVSGKVEAAYRRGDLFEKRRALMDHWARYCTAPVGAPMEQTA
jgi:integrase